MKDAVRIFSDLNSTIVIECKICENYVVVGSALSSGNLEKHIKEFREKHEKHKPPSVKEPERCPCEFPEIEPCMKQCTCRTPILSAGCNRCCQYGSREQRLSAARRLVRMAGEALLVKRKEERP